MTIEDSDSPCSVLPETLPLFPLSGALLLPRGSLPLHVFEPRYVAMVEDALRDHRMIGMIQPRDPAQVTGDENTPLYQTGCAGKITDFSETGDGRFYITLSGICRFRVKEELPMQRGYRLVTPDWEVFKNDCVPVTGLDLDRPALRNLLEGYFQIHDLSCEWEIIDAAPDEKLISCLAMICPLDAGEKQALLEAECGRKRAAMFMTMLEMAVQGEKSSCRPGDQCH